MERRKGLLSLIWHGDHDNRAGRLTAFEIAMDLLRLRERISMVDLDLHLTGLHHVEELLGRRLEVGSARGVSEESRPGHVERALLRQNAQVKRRHRARRVTETHQESEWR